MFYVEGRIVFLRLRDTGLWVYGVGGDLNFIKCEFLCGKWFFLIILVVRFLVVINKEVVIFIDKI